MTTEWTTISTAIQGGVSYDFRKSVVTSTYIDFDLIVFGEAWYRFDIVFEYRTDSRNVWKTDASIISSTSEYVRGNRILGLTVSQDGTSHSIRWKYSNNNIGYGSDVSIRVRVLPRTQIYGKARDIGNIVSNYGDSLVELNDIAGNICVGRNNTGQYICISDISVYILDSLSDTVPVYSYAVSDPRHAFQINSGRYIVADYGNARVIELDSTMTTISKTYVGTCTYADYSEENETLLVAEVLTDDIVEITWSDIDDGTVLWTSNYAFSNPVCATYRQGNVDNIIVADPENSRVVKCDRLNGTYTDIGNYKINKEDVGPFEISALKEPFRVF